MNEQRKHDRFVVMGVEGTLMFATDVDILDVSLNGVALKANKRLEIGREYTLKLQFKEKVISLNGIVVWSVLSELGKGHHDEKIPIYKAGMRFTDIMSEKMAKLLEFIQQSKPEHDNRLTIRFDVKSPSRASLGGPHNYKVKTVSDNGMLIEADLPFDVEEQLLMEIKFHGDKTVRFMGRVASCRAITAEVPRHYDIGIEFMEISGDDKSRFQEFIKFLRTTRS